ncbi:hypothetical protein Raf01_98620 [Rugosimonospora africana]|uniref:Uncharacterized protein n=1 Tax=Rugosimonospora africana TaxID=556532 RepID=A0A8J3R2C1_9ACTN|nr:hypothetical protein Raf01_98620 [Rugosimonospora africana]
MRGITAHAATPGAGGLTPSDLPLVDFSQDEIDEIEDEEDELATDLQRTASSFDRE